MLAIKSAYGLFLASDWKTPSAMVDRQMLPRQTNRTEMGEDIGMSKEIGRYGIGGAWVGDVAGAFASRLALSWGRRRGTMGGKGFQGLGCNVSTPPTHASRLANIIINDSHGIGLQTSSLLQQTETVTCEKARMERRDEWRSMLCPRHRLRQVQTFQSCRSAAAASCRLRSGAQADAQTHHSPIN